MDATITLSAELTNTTTSVPLPLTVDTLGKARLPLITFSQRQAGQPWEYHWKVTWKYGRRLASANAINSYGYLLPFRSGVHAVIQAAHGQFTHNIGSESEEAIDFEMPVGTLVSAARGGTVVATRADCSEGGLEPRLWMETNCVVIRHSDGTYGEYLHLQKNGVLVHVGDSVTAGQSIALSGSTGYTSEPHLHFMVFYNIDGTARKSIPIMFSSTHGQFRPQEGVAYRAGM
jgi:murein DD-endopeptidase MepM/ murein hydrolase activator NlpD